MSILSFALMLLAAPAASPMVPASPPPPAPVADAVPLTAEGWGPLRIGMTEAEVVAALGPDNDPEAVGGPEPESCDQWTPARAPADMLVMIEEGRLTSIWLIDDARVRTDRGLGLGATAGQVRQTYGGAVRARPHMYQGDGAEYLTIWSHGGATGQEEWVESQDARGIRYETNEQGVVTTIGVGGPSIQYVEGCA